MAAAERIVPASRGSRLDEETILRALTLCCPNVTLPACNNFALCEAQSSFRKGGNHMPRYTLSLIWSLLILVPASSAQTIYNIEAWENLWQLNAGQRIRVVERNMKTHDGTFLSYSEEAMSLRVGSNDVGIRRENVIRVSNREENKRLQHAVKGALIGAGVGPILALALFVIRPEAFFDHPGLKLFATMVGPAGVGAGIGAAIPSHPTVYRAPTK